MSFNQFSSLDAQNSEDRLAQIVSEENHSEAYSEDSHLESQYEERTEEGWPGDGTGTDDFADYNQNEADDYLNE
jgi:hypothetical protein